MCKKIVVVDDLPLTLDFIRFHLESAGYNDIITHENPSEALLFLRTLEPVSVIITDFEMPQMNGLIFLKSVQTFREWIPAIITTCTPESALSTKPSYPVLQKGTPFFIEELIRFLSKEIKQVPLATSW